MSYIIFSRTISVHRFLYYCLIVVTVLSSILFISCDNGVVDPEESKTLRPLSIKWDSSNSIVCLGTSITNGKDWGLGPTPVDDSDFIFTIKPDSSYPALLGKKLRIKVDNQGVWGGIIDGALKNLNDSVISKRPVLVLLEMGANEFLRGDDVNEVELKLDQLIKSIKQHNIKVVFLSFFNPDMINKTPQNHFLLEKFEEAKEYFEMFKRVTKQNHIMMDDYILRDIWWKKEFMSEDGIHPNNKGKARLANNIFQSMVHTFRQNNMIK